MAKALIVYATLGGATKSLADRIQHGVRQTGHDAVVANANDIKKKDDLEGYDAYIIGSATYHGKMMQAMETVLFLAAKMNLEGLPGGSFGAFGWSGEASDRIYETMEHVFKMNMIGGPLCLKNVFEHGGSTKAEDYGRKIGNKIR